MPVLTTTSTKVRENIRSGRRKERGLVLTRFARVPVYVCDGAIVELKYVLDGRRAGLHEIPYESRERTSAPKTKAAGALTASHLRLKRCIRRVQGEGSIVRLTVVPLSADSHRCGQNYEELTSDIPCPALR